MFSGYLKLVKNNTAFIILTCQEKVTDSMPKSTHVSNRTNGHPYGQPVMSMDNDDGISYKGMFVFASTFPIGYQCAEIM